MGYFTLLTYKTVISGGCTDLACSLQVIKKRASPINDFSFAERSTQIHQKDITKSYPI
jgi:hypothetical protein